MPDPGSLLPHSATAQERAQSALDARIDQLPAPCRALWNPLLCPVSLLPHLAHHMSVDQWDDNWPEAVRRQVIADALYQHRIKGSRLGVEQAVASLGTVCEIIEWWQTEPQGEPHTFRVAVSAQENEQHLPVLELAADAAINTSVAIPVNAARVYRYRVKFRALSAGPNELAAGVINLGQDYLAAGSPAHRPVIHGIKPAAGAGWVTYEGEISGFGEGGAHFSPGTVYVRPYIRSAGTDDQHRLQIAQLELWDLFDDQQLVPNPRFSSGKTGWSSLYEGEVVADNAPGVISTAAFVPGQTLQADLFQAVNQAKPLRSHFDLTVGTIHPGTFHWRGDVRQVALSRETWA